MKYLMCLILATTVLADPPEPKFRAQVIDDKIQIGYGVAVADVDGDDKPDILLADKKQFVWYRNPTWEKFVIAENLTKRDNVCLAAADLDGDGKCDLAVGADFDPNDRETSGAVFYLIAPTDRTQKWEPVKLHAEPTVHRMRWMKLQEGGWGLVVAPLHGRGKDGAAGSRILLYLKPDDPRDQWKTQLIDDSMHATHNFDVVGPSALIIAGKEGLLDVQYSPHLRTIVDNSKSAGEVRASPSFIATIEPMHGNQLVVQTNTERHVLTDHMVEGHALACGDLLSIKSNQIVAGWRGGGGGVRLFTPLNRDHSRWRESVVDDKGMACEDLCLADLNADGKLDIIASGRATKNVKIYWNETAPPASQPAAARP